MGNFCRRVSPNSRTFTFCSVVVPPCCCCGCENSTAVDFAAGSRDEGVALFLDEEAEDGCFDGAAGTRPDWLSVSDMTQSAARIQLFTMLTLK